MLDEDDLEALILVLNARENMDVKSFTVNYKESSLSQKHYKSVPYSACFLYVIRCELMIVFSMTLDFL